MPKFTIEIDTDAKTCVKTVNGVEMDFDEISLYQYSYEVEEGKKEYEYGARISMDVDNGRISHNYFWTEGGGNTSDLEYSKVKAAEKASEEDIKKKRYYLFDQYKQEGGKDYKKKDK